MQNDYELLLQRHRKKSFLHRIVKMKNGHVGNLIIRRAKNHGADQATINIDGKEYSRRQAHALYLVGSAECSVLCSIETITGKRYQQQLMQLSRILKQK